jgi:hypothetical protein
MRCACVRIRMSLRCITTYKKKLQLRVQFCHALSSLEQSRNFRGIEFHFLII